MGETNSRCGPLDPENEMDLGIPPLLSMCVYSALRSTFSLGVSASDALIGSTWLRIGPTYGALRHALESGRMAGSVLNPGFPSSFPGDRAVAEYVCGIRSERI